MEREIRPAENKTCQNCKQEFRIEPEDFLFYQKIEVPPPTFCPECRMIRRFAFRNERFLFRRKDDVSGKEIFSEIPPQTGAKIYEHDYWWSDKWDPMAYGRKYDFSRSFFEQFYELMYSVPWPSRNAFNLINSDYANNAGNLKNCYLCFDSGSSQDCAYIVDAFSQKNCFDITGSSNGELCYDSTLIENCYQTFYSINCVKCSEVWFCRDVDGCSNCFGCANLRNKQYYIFNKPYSKEEYSEKIKELALGSFRSFNQAKEQALNLWKSVPYEFMSESSNVNVSGDLIAHSKNALVCYNITDVEDSKFCQHLFRGVSDSYDFTNWGDKCELMYEVFGSGLGCRNIKFSLDCWPSDRDIEYCVKCKSASNLFGCVSLSKKSYCIFNKQYEKGEYESLKAKIIEQMKKVSYVDKSGNVYNYGEFFPFEFSPFAYNESQAQDYFPLTKETAAQKGYVWREPEAKEYKTTLDSKDLPDAIQDVTQSITNEIIKCAMCAKAYRVIASEFGFLQSNNLPLPRVCQNCRYMERIALRNKPVLYMGKCQCAGEGSSNGVYENQGKHSHGATPCSHEFQTSYSLDRPEIVYCKECYQSEVL